MCCYCLGCCGKEQTESMNEPEHDASGQQTIGTPAQQQIQMQSIQMQPIQMQQIHMQPLNQPPPPPQAY